MSSISALFVLSRFEQGGLERVHTNVLPGLREAGVQVQMLTSSVSEGAGTLLHEGLRLRALGGGRVVFLFRLLRVLREERPDVVFTSANDVGCFVLLLRRLFWPNSKVVWSQHLSISGPLKAARGARKLRLYLELMLMRRLLSRADAVVAVSRSVAYDIDHSVVSHPNLKVILNPVVSEDLPERCRVDVDWPWPDYSVPTVIFVGRLAPVKRVDLLLEAFAKVLDKVSARLLIVGDGPEMKRLKRFSKKLGLLELCAFVGRRNDAIPWIHRSELLVLCSESEGFGLVLVEAMACGVQVISTNCPDGPSEVLDGGRYGCLVPVNDIDSLAEAMVQGIGRPTVRKSDLQARAAEFGVKAAVIQYLAVLEEVARS